MTLGKLLGGGALVAAGVIASPFLLGLALSAAGGLVWVTGIGDGESVLADCSGAASAPPASSSRRSAAPILFQMQVVGGRIVHSTGAVLAEAISRCNDVLRGTDCSGSITCREKEGVRRLRFQGTFSESLKQRLRNVLLNS